MKESILVVGGAGYIGSHMVSALLDNKHNVVILDDLSTGKEDNIHPDAVFVEGSVFDLPTIIEVIETHNVSFVYHFAARLIVEESVREPLAYYRTNVFGTLQLLKAMKETNVTKLVFSSTAAVYGEPIDVPISENAACFPQNPYGTTKYMAEQLIKDYALAHPEMRYGILRYFNVIGRDEKYVADYSVATHVLSNILDSAATKESFLVFGDTWDTSDGTGVRDYVDVRDLVDAHYRTMERMNSGSESLLYNVGTSKGYSVMNLISEAEKIIGSPINYTIEQKRQGDVGEVRANADAIRSELGWNTKYSLGDSIQSMWSQYED